MASELQTVRRRRGDLETCEEDDALLGQYKDLFNDPHFSHTNGKYQTMSPLQYHGFCGGKAGPFLQRIFHLAWLAYILYVEIQAAVCLAYLDHDEILNLVKNQAGVPGFNGTYYVNISPILSKSGWVTLLAIAEAWAFGWLLWGIIVASANAQAIRNWRKGKGDEAQEGVMPFIPYPPLIISLWWSIVTFIIWSVLLAGGLYFYYFLPGNWSQLGRLVAYCTLMLAVILLGVIDTFDDVLKTCRAVLDLALWASNSSCFEF